MENSKKENTLRFGLWKNKGKESQKTYYSGFVTGPVAISELVRLVQSCGQDGAISFKLFDNSQDKKSDKSPDLGLLVEVVPGRGGKAEAPPAPLKQDDDIQF